MDAFGRDLEKWAQHRLQEHRESGDYPGTKNDLDGPRPAARLVAGTSCSPWGDACAAVGESRPSPPSPRSSCDGDDDFPPPPAAEAATATRNGALPAPPHTDVSRLDHVYNTPAFSIQLAPFQ
ncbi:hypothetical protein GGTG_11894 [Gaeumannomyces tritici R3-111a-1]|uniref:Uncharacterized protein n=1 Tax=Gaeumannomyces tritici (strain R3-111a-1) TaxID=644352 RepID=J3PEG3_GAET3|nr:hypothetical protein GGTG_11894 [Gaeumannomyces tritici R3-111a-1]EJT70871.1 hypothetical protein GGTG_11894 [Gaeumannomyces tritici R3-111a-1]